MQRAKISIIRLGEIDSTNLYAKANLADIADKTVVISDKQTNGRGRFERAWVDLGDGNIFMSLVLKPANTFNPVNANLTQYFSLLLCKLLEEYNLKPQIKWPNDVLVDGKKIAGILSETVMQGNNFKGLVLGAGINLNAQKEDLSWQTDNYAVCPMKGFSMIENDYINRACFLGKEISVKGFNETFTGVAKSVNSRGELVLEKDNREFVLTMGDIL